MEEVAGKHQDGGTRSSLSRPVAQLVGGVLIAAGLAARVLPLVQDEATLLRQPSEDGYLMLTVARNMAVGLGMSSAQGTIPTNGVQPLSAFLDLGCFALAGGDKVRGVGIVMALSALIALLSLVAVYRLGRVVFAKRADGESLALLSAALWFASPVVLPHSMNALETGLYFLVLAITMRFFLVQGGDPDRDMPWGKAALLGGLLGVAFWTRNDAIFLVAAIAICRLGSALSRPVSVLVRRASELLLTGVVMALVACPWMISNALRFGSIVPISGKAESTTTFGVNLPHLPAKLAEFVMVTGAIPNELETRSLIQAACVVLVLAAVAAAIGIIRRGAGAVRTVALLGLCHAVLLSAFYGVFFGAGHFLPRYTSPISILCTFLTVAVVVELLGRWRQEAAPALFALMALIAVLTDLRHYRKRNDHEHFQVVEWTTQNVGAEVWVGAIQTGTLGFFHDRTINLDGKTNPEALKANRSQESMKAYVIGSKIHYLVD